MLWVISLTMVDGLYAVVLYKIQKQNLMISGFGSADKPPHSLNRRCRPKLRLITLRQLLVSDFATTVTLPAIL